MRVLKSKEATIVTRIELIRKEATNLLWEGLQPYKKSHMLPLGVQNPQMIS